jgi:hypothetical protein
MITIILLGGFKHGWIIFHASLGNVKAFALFWIGHHGTTASLNAKPTGLSREIWIHSLTEMGSQNPWNTKLYPLIFYIFLHQNNQRLLMDAHPQKKCCLECLDTLISTDEVAVYQ